MASRYRIGKVFTSATLALPEAVLDLRQGVGRLIRTPTDHGVLLLLDNRILTEAYGKSFARIWHGKHKVAKSLEELQALLTNASVAS